MAIKTEALAVTWTVENPESPFHGMTEEQARMFSAVMCGYRVRVLGHRHGEGPEEFDFERVLFHDSYSLGTCLLDCPGTMILRHPEHGRGSTRHITLDACLSFEVIGPQRLECEWCFNFVDPEKLRFTVDYEWWQDDPYAHPSYRWECLTCLARRFDEDDLMPEIRYGMERRRREAPKRPFTPQATTPWMSNCDFTVRGESRAEVDEKIEKLTRAAKRLGIKPPHIDHEGPDQ